MKQENLEYVRNKLEKLIYYLHDITDSFLLWCLYKIQRPRTDEQAHDEKMYTDAINLEMDKAIKDYLANMNNEKEWEHSDAAYMVMVGVETPEGHQSLPMYFTHEQWEMVQSLSKASKKPVMEVILDIAADRWEMSNNDEEE